MDQKNYVVQTSRVLAIAASMALGVGTPLQGAFGEQPGVSVRKPQFVVADKDTPPAVQYVHDVSPAGSPAGQEPFSPYAGVFRRKMITDGSRETTDIAPLERRNSSSSSGGDSELSAALTPSADLASPSVARASLRFCSLSPQGVSAEEAEDDALLVALKSPSSRPASASKGLPRTSLSSLPEEEWEGGFDGSALTYYQSLDGIPDGDVFFLDSQDDASSRQNACLADEVTGEKLLAALNSATQETSTACDAAVRWRTLPEPGMHYSPVLTSEPVVPQGQEASAEGAAKVSTATSYAAVLSDRITRVMARVGEQSCANNAQIAQMFPAISHVSDYLLRLRDGSLLPLMEQQDGDESVRYTSLAYVHAVALLNRLFELYKHPVLRMPDPEQGQDSRAVERLRVEGSYPASLGADALAALYASVYRRVPIPPYLRERFVVGWMLDLTEEGLVNPLSAAVIRNALTQSQEGSFVLGCPLHPSDWIMRGLPTNQVTSVVPRKSSRSVRFDLE